MAFAGARSEPCPGSMRFLRGPEAGVRVRQIASGDPHFTRWNAYRVPPSIPALRIRAGARVPLRSGAGEGAGAMPGQPVS